jgi:hypothetical protein
VLQPGKLGSVIADIPGVRILEERMTVRVHSKYSNREVDVYPELWLVRHAIVDAIILVNR